MHRSLCPLCFLLLPYLQAGTLLGSAASLTVRCCFHLTCILASTSSISLDRLAYEITTTNQAQQSLQSTKAKLGKKVWEMEKERVTMATAAKQTMDTLREQVLDVKKEANEEVERAKEKIELEVGLNSSVLM